MKRLLVAVAVLAVTVLPSFAADGGTPDTGMGVPANEGMMQHPEAMKQMMRNPHHVLAMAYHKNVITFGRALAKVAEQGDTVPTDFARSAIAEMRRSTSELERHRAAAMGSMPAEMRGELQKHMDEHLVQVKTGLRQLEDLAKRDPIPSREVLNQLQPLLQACNGTQCDLPRRGLHGKGMEGKRAMPGDCHDMMMPEHQQMMHEMTQELKAQDAAMMKQVAEMKRAPRDKKIDLMSEIVARIVQQRAEMTVRMEKMQRPMMGRPMAPPPPPPMMNGDDEDTDDDNLEY